MPIRVPRGVVFDLDGLLLDTESRWTRAEGALFERYDSEFSIDEKRALLGSSLSAAGLLLERLLGLPGRAEQLSAELLELAIENIPGAAPMPGALDLLKRLSGGPLVGLATNSVRRLADPVIEAAGLNGSFATIVAGDEVSEPKPAPDLYLEVCRRLGVGPNDAVALEDSPNGVASARAAGLYVIGIPSVRGVALEADVVAPTLDHPDVREALGLRND